MQTEPNQDDHQQQEGTTAPVAPDVQALEAAPSTQDRNAEQDPAEERPPATPQVSKLGGWWNVRATLKWSNIVIAVATVANVFVAFCQFRAIGASNEAANRAAVATENAVTQARDAQRIDQRAWVYPNQFLLNQEPRPGVQINVTVYLANTGKTPAIIQHQAYIGVTGRYECAPPTEAEWNEIPLGSPESALYPGVTNLAFPTSSVELPPEAIAEYGAARSVICVNTRITYRDIFGEEHFADACRSRISGDRLTAWVSCRTGNAFGDTPGK